MKARSVFSNPALLTIVAEGFLSRLSFGLISFALPLYAYHLGMKLSEIGILSSINLVVAMAFKPLMGAMADRFGLKRSSRTECLSRCVIQPSTRFLPSTVARRWSPLRLDGTPRQRAWEGPSEAP